MPTIMPLRRARSAYTGGTASGPPLNAGTDDRFRTSRPGRRCRSSLFRPRHRRSIQLAQRCLGRNVRGTSCRMSVVPDWSGAVMDSSPRHAGHTIDDQATMYRAHREQDRRESRVLQPGTIDGERPVSF